ncbi:BglG family transcription antiterminator [Marisediminicola senii]|uniref:BglG family transcription antiterminator n=1 Tax=Marisediminicola senii TaxID=2711233 RepID=UPI0013EC13D4|nr:PRD domain-containing protein [Marisediminicola senii]
MSDRHERLLEHLATRDGWVTAAELAGRLGVTTRSVRSYVTAVKSLAHPLEVIESSTSGYRVNRDDYSAFLASRSSRTAETERPRDRVYHLVRRLAEAPDGLDVHALADSLFVSESTIEADLRKLRRELSGTDLTLVRRGPLVSITGSEQNLRRLLSRVFRDEGAQGFLELESIEREFSSSNLGAFKTDLLEMLDAHGYFVNEYGVNHVLLHVAIAVDRTTKHQLPPGPQSRDLRPGVDDIPADLSVLIETHFGTRLGEVDLQYLATLLTTRVITRGGVRPEVSGAANVDHEIDLMRGIVARVAEEYLIDLDDEEFMGRLALHVNNLIARARDHAYSRNPMSRSIKTSYPMIYELAVFIASEIQRLERIEINDDEISYIAMHVGAYLERQSRREERVTCAIVTPNYYDMHVLLRDRIEAAFGVDLQIDVVITRTDVEWSELASDVVVTTIAAGAQADNVVVVQPFPTEHDLDAVRRAIARVRRQRRRARLKEDLLHFFDESMFLRNVPAESENAMIRMLGDRMIGAGVIGADYVTGAIDRERMSSTAFTDTLAVPHSMAMSAERTAICIAVNETPMDWGDSRVSVVALIAFSASDRATFQAIFDQFVSVFADGDDVRELIRRSVDFPSFIEEIVRSMDK